MAINPTIKPPIAGCSQMGIGLRCIKDRALEMDRMKTMAIMALNRPSIAKAGNSRKEAMSWVPMIKAG